MARQLVVRPFESEMLILTERSVDEVTLQQQLHELPQLLPVDEYGFVGPPLVLGRETRLASGAPDLLLALRSGELCLVEFKTGPQNPDFRHALAQLLDYGADLWGMDLATFESTVAVRYFTGSRCSTDEPAKSAKSLDAAARATWPGIPDDEIAKFLDLITGALLRGAFHYIVVAQRFTEPMVTTAQYLTAAQPDSRFYLVELVAFEGSGTQAFEARTVFRPTSGGTRGLAPPQSEADFLGSITDDSYREALREIFELARQLDLSFEWGTKGASIRATTPYRKEPVSVAWVFPSAGGGWMGLNDLTLGFDSRSTANDATDLKAALETYVTEVAAIDGGSQAQPANVVGSTFDSSAVCGHLAEIQGALTRATELLSGKDPADR